MDEGGATGEETGAAGVDAPPTGPGPDAPPSGAGLGRPWWRRRRTIVAGVVLLLAAYAGLVAARLLSARHDLEQARDLLEEWRDETDADTLLDRGDDPRLARAQALLESAADAVGGPLLLPVRLVPVAGTQVDAVESLTTSARDLVRAGRVALAAMSDEVDEYEVTGDRLALVDAAAEHIERLRSVIRGADLGPGTGLIGPLPEVRREYVADYVELTAAVDDAAAAAASVAALLRTDGPYLVLGANNAEMRAGAGMVLSLGEMTVGDGDVELGEIQPVSEIPAFDPVPIDAQLDALYGDLTPGGEIRNINVLPSFPRVAEIAAAQWREITGTEVEGVVLLDSVGLATMVGATGPLGIDGVTYDEPAMLDYLLTGQYLEFDEAATAVDGNAERRDRLGEIADTVFDALQADVDAPALVRALRTAVRQRHLMIWSADAEVQAGWEAVDAAGVLQPDSLLVAILNRGGDKMDAFLSVEAELSFTPAAGGGTDATLRVSLHNTTPGGLPQYVTGRPPEAGDERQLPAEYVGILSLSLPGAAGSITVEGGDEVVRGPDGPSEVVGVRISVPRTERAEIVVRFHLPDDRRQLRIEPTGRARPVAWIVDGVSILDGRAHTVPVG